MDFLGDIMLMLTKRVEQMHFVFSLWLDSQKGLVLTFND